MSRTILTIGPMEITHFDGQMKLHQTATALSLGETVLQVFKDGRQQLVSCKYERLLKWDNTPIECLRYIGSIPFDATGTSFTFVADAKYYQVYGLKYTPKWYEAPQGFEPVQCVVSDNVLDPENLVGNFIRWVTEYDTINKQFCTRDKYGNIGRVTNAIRLSDIK